MALHICPHCEAVVGSYDQQCGFCGKGLSGIALLAENRPTASGTIGPTPLAITRVSIVAIDVPFWDMVNALFMIAVAAIPALIMASVVIVGVMLAIGFALGLLGVALTSAMP